MFHHIDIAEIIRVIGYVGVLLIIFAETGLFIGFFLPGDSLVFTAGLLAAQHVFNAGILIPSMIAAAIIGYFVAYWFGKKLGHWLMKRKDSIWFKKKYMIETERFYNKHGILALITGRLIPVVRTFVPIVAGMVNMDFRRYSLLNVVGGFIWAGGLSLIGFYLGKSVPHISKYLAVIIFLIIFISISPVIWELIKKYRHSL